MTKNFSSQILNLGIKTTQNFTLIFNLRKNAKMSLTKKLQAKKVTKLEFSLFYITNLKKFLANNFFRVHFFQLFPRI
jgi:hypothetical protein